MRTMILAALLGTAQPLAAAAQTAAPAPAPVDIRTEQLADGVYRFTTAADGYVENLNTVAVVMDDGVLVFDTQTRPSSARRILAEIGRLTGKPVTMVVNSHWHPDHWSGNEVFAEANPALAIVSTEQERDFMLNMTSLWPSVLPRSKEAVDKEVAALFAAGKDENGAPLTPASRARIDREQRQVRDLVDEQLKVKRTYPNLTYTDRLVLRRGGREIVLMSVTGDAAGTTVMYLPKERILVTGDAVSHPLPYYTPPLSEHAASLRRLAALGPAMVVPGHGPVFRDTAYMLREADFFEAVLQRVQDALRAGAVSIDEVQKAVSFDDFEARFAGSDPQLKRLFPQWTGGLVRKAYIELRDSKEIR